MANDNSGLDDFRSIYDRAELDADVSKPQFQIQDLLYEWVGRSQVIHL